VAHPPPRTAPHQPPKTDRPRRAMAARRRDPRGAPEPSSSRGHSWGPCAAGVPPGAGRGLLCRRPPTMNLAVCPMDRGPPYSQDHVGVTPCRIAGARALAEAPEAHIVWTVTRRGAYPLTCSLQVSSITMAAEYSGACGDAACVKDPASGADIVTAGLVEGIEGAWGLCRRHC